MKLRMKYYCLMFCFVYCSLFSSAQTSVPGNQTGTIDPIVEMLDSLVTLNNVVRHQAVSYTGASSQEPGISTQIPQFSDEVYTSRIKNISSPIPLEFNEQVKKYIDLYAFHKRNLTSRVLGLSDLYFPIFEEALDKEGLPLEFKYLSIVESALNPTAVSRVGATGIWQFMYNTGKLYDLKINSYIDERRDPVKATYAACRYFKNMHDIYKDWLLVIAAYNCGPGNVNRAIVRSGGKTNFWEISRFLPAETRGYVPAFVAICYVMNYSVEHNISKVAPDFTYFQLDTLRINQRTTLAKISSTADVPLDVLRYLNPIYKKGIIPASSSEYAVIKLPSNRVLAFMESQDKIFALETPEPAPVLAKLNINESNKPGEGFEFVYQTTKKTHTVRRGETLGAIAKKYDCSTSEIKKLNRLKTTKLKAGQKLKVTAQVRVKKPIATTTPGENITVIQDSVNKDTAMAVNSEANNPDSLDDDKSSEKHASASKLKDQKIVYHIVQKGDTLWNIAQRYEGVTVKQIMKLNSISNIKNLKAGSKLKIAING